MRFQPREYERSPGGGLWAKPIPFDSCSMPPRTSTNWQYQRLASAGRRRRGVQA
jgi:hypothetical protein